MAKSKLYCAEHKRTFKGGQGFAAHLRRFHPNLPAAPAPASNGKPATIDIHTHLDLALVSVNAQIKVDEDHLTMLRSQREHIVAALGADYIPF